MSEDKLTHAGFHDVSEYRVIEVLKEWHDDNSFDGGTWESYSNLSARTEIPIKKLKKIMKKFREEGIVHYTWTVNSDYRVAGSGYFLNERHPILKEAGDE
jgi:hypothetical protein